MVKNYASLLHERSLKFNVFNYFLMAFELYGLLMNYLDPMIINSLKYE